MEPTQLLLVPALCILLATSSDAATPASDPAGNIVVGNAQCRLVIGPDGRTAGFIDARSGKDYLNHVLPLSFASVRMGEKTDVPSKAFLRNGDLVVEFADSDVKAVFRLRANDDYLTIEVVSLKGENVTRLGFLNAVLDLRGSFDEPFSACAMALNLKTNVEQIPGLSSAMNAFCYPRFGFEGAKVAIIGCPPDRMRAIMKKVVKESPELPESGVGGPWAWEAPINRGSYFLDSQGITENTAADWAALANRFGIDQIDFNVSFRHGDFRPNPGLYPDGLANVKAVVDRLHASGIKAGLHTYAFFIDKASRYVTPVPDPRLGKSATFTLAEALPADAQTVPVVESTAGVSAMTGFFVQNSSTIRIDDELITFGGATKQAPFKFTECKRGAWGTAVSEHPKGAKVHQLRECFGLFAPDADSTLLTEVAANIANTCNECGFDMIYLDALDGEGVLAGGENAWHYGSKFTWEIAKRLKRPALMEMSTFHHHLWYLRSRMGAWDVGFRDRKAFIDHHANANRVLDRQFLPGQMGWWNLGFGPDWQPTQTERAFQDEIELLMCRCLAFDNGFSLLGVDIRNIKTTPVFQRMAPILRQYEELRRSRSVPESTLVRLRNLDEEFMLEKNSEGKPQFRPMQFDKHKANGPGSWKVQNLFDRQPVRLRIEALYCVKPYDSPDAVLLDDFSSPEAFAPRNPGSQTTGTLVRSTEQVRAGAASGLLKANGDICLWRDFSPELSLGQNCGLGLWVRGDGQGETLRLRLGNPGSWYNGSGDFYIPIDFTGWSYFELIEPDSKRSGNWTNSLYWQHVNSFSLWMEDVPKGKTVSCCLSPIKALPAVACEIRSPRVTIDGMTITFPVTIKTNCYLEYNSDTDCKLYSAMGEVLADIKPIGAAPMLDPGDNTVEFGCECPQSVTPRANVTVISASSEILPAVK